MQVHRNTNELPQIHNAVVTIGTFDGVHTGHKKIIGQLKDEAAQVKGETVLITFHPHPRKVLGDASRPIQLINTLDEKIELLAGQGLDHLVIVPFTKEFSNLSADEYINDFLIGKFSPHTVIIGYDHRFGHDRKGDYRLLEEYAARLQFRLKEIPEHVIDAAAVSSTRIREAIRLGNTDAANELLGYDFFFEGEVIHGNKLGKTLGYPTANIQLNEAEKLVPGDGIYAVEAIIDPEHPERSERSRMDRRGGPNNNTPAVNALQLKPEGLSNPERSRRIEGRANPSTTKLKGMMSIGYRPTIGDNKHMIEVNLFDFDEEIYGQTMRVYVKAYMRPELKFNGLEALKEQLHKDEIEARYLLSK